MNETNAKMLWNVIIEDKLLRAQYFMHKFIVRILCIRINLYLQTVERKRDNTIPHDRSPTISSL